jgi:hypothetical protein
VPDVCASSRHQERKLLCEIFVGWRPDQALSPAEQWIGRSYPTVVDAHANQIRLRLQATAKFHGKLLGVSHQMLATLRRISCPRPGLLNGGKGCLRALDRRWGTLWGIFATLRRWFTAARWLSPTGRWLAVLPPEFPAHGPITSHGLPWWIEGSLKVMSTVLSVISLSKFHL